MSGLPSTAGQRDAKLGASPSRGIARAALTVAAMTAVVRAGSVAKELTVAWKFGTGDDLEAFLIALLVPLAAISIITSSLNSSFIPAYIHVKEREGEAASREFFRGVTTVALVSLGLLTALIIITSPLYLPLIGSGFGPEKLSYTSELLYVSAPVVIVSGVAALWAAALNAEGRFAVAAIAPLATPSLTAALLWLIPGWRGRSLIVGLLGGELLEMLLLAITLKRRGFSLAPARPRIDPYLRRLFSQYLPVVAGSILMSGNIMVDQAMAATLPAGSVAALSYGNNVVQFPILLAATALGTTLTPYFSQFAAAGNREALCRVVHHFMTLALLLAVPLALFLFFFSHPITALLFKRGAFTETDVNQVGRVVACYALEIPFYIAAIITARLVSALQQNRILFWGAAIGLPLNLILNYVFMKSMGVAGIALATSLVYLFLTAFSYASGMKLLRKAERHPGRTSD